ncbi:MAG: TonB-dependent receptor [Pseudomonadota bacterium]
MRVAKDLTSVIFLGSLLFAVRPAVGNEQEKILIDVPSQDLEAALTEFGSETGVQVSARSEALSGKKSMAVNGVMSPLEALSVMLSDTGLRLAEPFDGGAVVTQNLDGSEAFDLGTVVVSGELIERDVQDSQTSVTVITGEELETRSETSLADVVNRVPGVTVNSNSAAPSITIRGVAIDGPAGGGVEVSNTVNVTVDGAAISESFNADPTSFSTWDVRQVEILRGPQSTQSGRNAIAGAINVRSADPEYFEEYRFRFGVGNLGTRSAAFVANTPIVDDRLSFRLSADRETTDGSVLNPVLGIEDMASFEQTTVRASLRFDPTDRFGGVLKYTFVEQKSGSSSIASNLIPQRLNFADVKSERGFSDYDSWNLRFHYDVNESVRFESETTFTDFDTLRTDPTGILSLPGSVRRFDETAEIFDQEFKLVYDTERVRAVGGISYSQIDQRTAGVNPISAGPFVLNADINSTYQIENYAVFGEAEVDISEKWTMILGARYDFEENDRKFQSIITPIDPLGLSRDLDASADFSAFLPKVGLVYRFTDDQSLGFTAQRGYRSGGSGITPATSNLFEFDPEFTTNYELSYRSEWDDGSVIVNANAFYTDWEDQQVLVFLAPGAGTGQIFNAASSRQWGAEFDIRATPSPQLQLVFAGAYIDTEFVDFNPADLGDVSAGDVSGNRFVGAPEFSATLGADYDFLNGLSIGGDIVYTGSTFSDIENNPAFENDDYFLVNLRAQYDITENVSLNVFVNNLFDEFYTISRTEGRDTTAGDPRTFGFFVSSYF